MKKDYYIILLKHLREKKIFIIIFLILSVGLIYLTCKNVTNAVYSALSSVTISALVILMFLDSIKQYNDEQKFLQISKQIKENILNSYGCIFHILNSTLSDSPNNAFFSELGGLVNDSNINIISQNIQTIEIFDNSKLGERDTIIANNYMMQLKNKISKTLDLIKSTPYDLEVYILIINITNLLLILDPIDKFHFDASRDQGLIRIIAGINTSLIKRILNEYCTLYQIINDNPILSGIPVTLTIEAGMAVAIQEQDGTIRNAI